MYWKGWKELYILKIGKECKEFKGRKASKTKRKGVMNENLTGER